MSTTPQAIQVALRYDGKVFVPDQPFPNLPPGTIIRVWTSTEPTDWPPGYLESVVGQGEDMDADEPPLIFTKPQTPEEWEAFVKRTAGSWADFDFIEPEELPYDKEESVI